MQGTLPSRSRHHSMLAVLVLYGVVMVAASFLHHDFACHQNSRTHCTACNVSQYAQKAEAHGSPLDAIHRVAGRVNCRSAVRPAPPALVFISDRAPPA